MFTLPFCRCSENFKKVYWISGNHEYYMQGTYTIDECLGWKRDICKHSGDNVVPLDNEIALLRDDIVLIGSTMWTNIPIEMAPLVEQKINDYRQIKDFTVPYQNQLHFEAKKFLHDSLDRFGETHTTIVATHHAPVEKLTISKQWRGTPLNPVFATNVEHLVQKADYWIFGHTHYTTEFTLGKCKVMSNCKGYGRDTDDKFTTERTILFD